MGITINHGIESYDALSRIAADFVAKEITQKLNCTNSLNSANKNGEQKFVLGLPTGSTPLGMYKNLIALNKSNKIDFAKVSTFNLDEYYPIKRDNAQSYYKFMFDNFFGQININPTNVNIPNGEAQDFAQECISYEQKINNAGGIDLMVIGIGANGHIGFNEPGDFLHANTHSEDLTQDTREKNARFFNSIEEVPTKALTMGMGSILRARKILMLVSGEIKRETFKSFMTGKISTNNPASFLYLHNDVLVLSDVGV